MAVRKKQVGRAASRHQSTVSSSNFAQKAGSLANIWQESRDKIVRGDGPSLSTKRLGEWSQRFSKPEIEALVIPKRTLARRSAKGEPLSPDESDKAFRLARISALADRVFGNPDKAGRWLRKPHADFGGRAPIELLSSETGAIAVQEKLIQIDYGIVA